ncbi:MAG: hypothetical protein KKH32_06350, partial [Bacteroidetes bacterium]|nr:hypothetical protein [Bacteroidota bacterium]
MKTILISFFLFLISIPFVRNVNACSDSSECPERCCSIKVISNSGVNFFPNNFLYKPNYSNPFEAKIGPHFVINESNLQLDIGAAKDLIHYRHNREQHFGFGAEFF